MSEEKTKKIERLSQVLDLAARSANPRDYDSLVKLAAKDTPLVQNDSKRAPNP